MPEHADVIADNRVLATYMQGEAVYRSPALG